VVVVVISASMVSLCDLCVSLVSAAVVTVLGTTVPVTIVSSIIDAESVTTRWEFWEIISMGTIFTTTATRATKIASSREMQRQEKQELLGGGVARSVAPLMARFSSTTSCRNLALSFAFSCSERFRTRASSKALSRGMLFMSSNCQS